MIYLDNAATTFHKPPEVEKAVIEAFHTIGNAGRGAHSATLDASRVIYQTRQKLAELFNVDDAAQIAFTCNATEALNIAIQGLFIKGDHVITTECEHNSVLRPLYLMEKKGVKVSIISADEKGNIQYEQFEDAYCKDTKAVVITHASNVTGNVTDMSKITAFTQKHNLQLIVDASQTAGILPIDVKKMGVDVLCFTGHKGLLGPQGTGGIYVSKGIDIRPLKVGGSGTLSYSKEHPDVMPTALEAGTLNGHGIAGLNAALSYIEKTGVDEIHRREMKLADRFLSGIENISNVKVYGDFETSRRVATISINIGDYDSASVSDWLFEDYGIAVRSGAHCAPLMHKALGTTKQGAVRFSFSHFNTIQEVDKAIEAVRELAE